LLAGLLTGAGCDGSAGMKAVQSRGGVTVVQDPASAQVAAMPEAALRVITPDFRLSLEEIASLLRSLNAEACA
jgi:two-component system chemotaxis response regulator CheB